MQQLCVCSWGVNENGELGLGDKTNRGDRPEQMGDALPAVKFGTGRRLVELTGEFGVTVAVVGGGLR